MINDPLVATWAGRFVWTIRNLHRRHSGESRNPVQLRVRRTQKLVLRASHNVLKLDSGLRRNDEL